MLMTRCQCHYLHSPIKQFWKRAAAAASATLADTAIGNGTKFCVILEIPTGAISEKSNGFRSNTRIIIVNIFGEDIRCFMSSATHRKLDGLVQITHKVSDGGPAPTLLLGRNQTERENSRILI